MAFVTKIFDTSISLFEAAALDFTERALLSIEKEGRFRVALLGGETSKLFFIALTNLPFCLEKTPWAEIEFFFGDERYVPLEDIRSNYHTAYHYLFSKVPILKNHIHPMKTQWENPEKAAQYYEDHLKHQLKALPANSPLFHVIYLGLGEDGHTASLMPFNEVLKEGDKNWVKSLWVEKLKMNRITLMPVIINTANTIIFLVNGAHKSRAVKEVLLGPKTASHINEYPAQLIECQKEKTLWYLDSGAAKNL